MAKVSYIDIPAGYEEIYKRALQPGDRFTFSRVRVKDIFLSRSRVKGITQKSMLVELAPVWAAMSAGDKADWEAAGAASGLTGWKQFVVDTAERRKAGHAGYATPSTIYQSEVGRIEIESPATGLTIEQPHPLTYYTYRKVAGTRSQYNPVLVTEAFSFPIEIGISWKTDLATLDSDARARFYLQIFSSYQGRDIETILEIPFGMSDDWQSATASLSSVVGPVQSYAAFIEVYNCTGSLYFDNVAITHTGQNWARDPDCNNVSQSFTKAYAQIPRHWAAVDIFDGADFGSYYFFDTYNPALNLLELQDGGALNTEADEQLALENYAA